MRQKKSQGMPNWERSKTSSRYMKNPLAKIINLKSFIHSLKRLYCDLTGKADNYETAMKKIDTRCKDLGKRYSTVQRSGMDEECEREPEREVEQKKRKRHIFPKGLYLLMSTRTLIRSCIRRHAVNSTSLCTIPSKFFFSSSRYRSIEI